MSLLPPRRALALLGLATALPLSACGQVENLIGPRPNAVLLSLAHSATADTEVWAGQESLSTQAGLRAEQAGELYAEIERLCGRDEETGQLPDTCVVVPEGAEPSASIDGAVEDYLEAIESVPRQSHPLLTEHAIELMAAEEQEKLPVIEVDYYSLEDVAALLQQEYATIYGLDMAQAWVDQTTMQSLGSLIDSHQRRAVAVRDSLKASGQTLAPEAAYEPAEGEALPSDADSAMAFAHKLSSAMVTQWRAQAAAEENEETRAWLVQLAGDAERAYQQWAA